MTSSPMSKFVMAARSTTNTVFEEDTTNHESITMGNRVPKKTVRIERDYSMGDGIVQFHTEFPSDLQGRISPEEFLETMQGINSRVDYADRISWSVVFENIMEILTIYMWPVFFSTHHQRAIKQLHNFIDSQNQLVYNPCLLSISDPVKSAFMFVEIQLF